MVERDLATLRRELHAHPETGLLLPNTQQVICRELQQLPLEITRGRELSSVTAVLRGGASAGGRAQAVLLRADMDALPLQEEVELSYSSAVPGVMHACGHDLHVAALIGAARLLCSRQEELAGDVIFMFQPGEEGHDGAAKMIAEGVLDAAGAEVIATYAIHVLSSTLGSGVVASRQGSVMAAADGVRVTIHGAGGHGSAPHLAKDPVPAMAEMILATQTLITRAFDAFDPVIVSIGSVSAGTQRNIIPESATFEATIRTFTEDSRDHVEKALTRLYERIADAHGTSVSIDYSREYPAVTNDDRETDFALDTACALFGDARVQTLRRPLAASEDFSRLLQNAPGAMLFLGATAEGLDPATAPFNHSPRALFDDAVLDDGARYLAELALRRLSINTEPKETR